MAIIDIKKQYEDETKMLISQYVSKVKKSLAESHLENLVIQKEDGRVGWLRVTPTIYGFAIEFYPRTKSGKMSKLASGYVGNSVEKYFEPYKENK